MTPCRPCHRRSLTALLVCTALPALLLAGSAPAAAQSAPAPAEPPSIDAADRAAIIDDIAAKLDATYIFAETATAMIEHLRAQLAAGSYDELDRLSDFTRQLTEDLQSVSKDRHLRVGWDPEPPPVEPDPEDEERRRSAFEQRMRQDNYCFRKVERLNGNVGLLKLNCFAPASLGGDTAVAAMNFLAHVDALIFDLRDNGGGSPSMIQLLTSYLVAEPTHLNSFYIRESDETKQFWTPAHVDGRKLPDVPVWVLTSARTFSGAEEFSYNLRQLERATLVGETTGGGAHPVRTQWVDGYPVMINMPFGRAVNPVSGTNWEGTGVEPHVAVQADEAFAVAYAAALDVVVERLDDPARKGPLAFLVESMKLRQVPVELPAAALEEYVGTYGPRVIRREGGQLLYRRGEGAQRPLIPVGEDRFLLGEMDEFRIRFERDAEGRVVRLVGLYDDGREEPSERSEP